MIMAGYGVVHGTMTLGDFVAVNAFLIQLYMPLNMLGFAYREIRNALVNMEKMFGLLDVEAEIADKPGAPRARGERAARSCSTMSTSTTRRPGRSCTT